MSIFLLNIDRFSRFFHRRTQLEICNIIIFYKDPTSPQMCCYTTLWNVPIQCTGAQSTCDNQAAVQETPAFVSPDLWPPNSPDLNPVNYKICGVVQERLVEVWARLQQNVIDDAIEQWRRQTPVCGLLKDILSICCDCISYLGYGSCSSLKICWFIVKQDSRYWIQITAKFFRF